MLPDRSRSPFGHGPCGPCGGAFPRPAVVVPRPFLRVALQQTQGLLLSSEKTQEQKDREAHNRLHEAVERNEGFLKAHLGYHIQGSEAGPYTVVSQEALGVGVFSVVWPCADKDNKLVAMKVIRHQDQPAVLHRMGGGRRPSAFLKARAAALKDQDPESAAHVALLRDSFVHKVSSPQGELEYLCMCFEKLESNLRKVGKQPLEKVLQFGKQIMRALRYLHDVVGIVHCDVKPDNLLLRWDGLAVKLCDFGTARPSPELQAQDCAQRAEQLQPLFYRAPEVILGFTRGRKIDVWSAALTIYELIVGRIYLRNCHTPREVLEEIMQLRGPVTKEMLQGRLAAAYVNSKGFHTETRQVVSLESYQKRSLFTELASFADYGKESKKAAEEQAKAQLSRLIGATVVGATKRAGVDPQQRLTAAEACEMEVFKAVELPPMVDLQEAPPLPEEAPPPLPPDAPP
eukprot:g31997.t1